VGARGARDDFGFLCHERSSPVQDGIGIRYAGILRFQQKSPRAEARGLCSNPTLYRLAYSAPRTAVMLMGILLGMNRNVGKTGT